MKNSDIKVGRRYSATKAPEDWGIIDGQHITFDEKTIRVEVLPKPDVFFGEDGVVALPEHLNSPEWFWVKNINTDREHWINSDVYNFKWIYYETQR